MTLRWLLPLVIVAALLVGAAAALVAKNRLLVSAAPTVTPLPAETPRPQPTATVTIKKVTATPSTAATPPTAPTRLTGATPSASSPTAAELATIRAQGYTPRGRGAVTPAGSGGTLYAWPAVCTGSADGYCQKVFFFLDSRYLGTDTSKASNAITRVQAAGPQEIAVTYPTYAPQDPLCCPSGKDVTIIYHWTGSKLTPSGTPPGH